MKRPEADFWQVQDQPPPDHGRKRSSNFKGSVQEERAGLGLVQDRAGRRVSEEAGSEV